LDYRQSNPYESLTNGPKVYSITSGKGGVGKTLTTIHFAMTAQKLGKKVLIIDGDMGLANVDIVLGLQPRYNINDVIEGRISLDKIVLGTNLGFDVIPSGSGITQLTNLSYVNRIDLLEQVQKLTTQYNTILIDTGAGISDTVLHLNSIAKEIVVLTTPEPHAMTDAYAMMKVLNQEKNITHLHLVVNQSRSHLDGEKISARLSEVASKFLNINLNYLGQVPHDDIVHTNVMRRQAIGAQTNQSISGQAWTQIAHGLFNYLSPQEPRTNPVPVLPQRPQYQFPSRSVHPQQTSPAVHSRKRGLLKIILQQLQLSFS
jgi:flagellar biosynthesis protein FlhG